MDPQRSRSGKRLETGYAAQEHSRQARATGEIGEAAAGQDRDADARKATQSHERASRARGDDRAIRMRHDGCQRTVEVRCDVETLRALHTLGDLIERTPQGLRLCHEASLPRRRRVESRPSVGPPPPRRDPVRMISSPGRCRFTL